MTWDIIIITIVISLIKILVTCLPTGAVEWLLNKFSTHTRLEPGDVIITKNEKPLADNEKIQVINDFNKATFFEKHCIYPGNEESFLNPECKEAPFVIKTKNGKKDVILFVYTYNDHVYVAKQYPKKVIAYSLLSDNLQHHANVIEN
ncbi:YfmQ family protein [Bacillus taeanensis]|uniref:Uncharacterized protein n=1 Tax=Bacillus taeanensis TaxID=273032 RepID=A0A366XNG6_9BACI|nr:YfmQ family protein [Bacillus taeanensis]RBW67457.1 hypothetical protein DS031_22240 [Bacillus taeanensis]